MELNTHSDCLDFIFLFLLSFIILEILIVFYFNLFDTKSSKTKMSLRVPRIIMRSTWMHMYSP